MTAKRPSLLHEPVCHKRGFPTHLRLTPGAGGDCPWMRVAELSATFNVAYLGPGRLSVLRLAQSEQLKSLTEDHTIGSTQTTVIETSETL